MTDDEIRQVVRQAIARHLGGAAPGAPAPAPAPPGPSVAPLAFARYPLPRAADDVACVIEPSVRCNHCGYCQCHGH